MRIPTFQGVENLLFVIVGTSWLLEGKRDFRSRPFTVVAAQAQFLWSVPREALLVALPLQWPAHRGGLCRIPQDPVFPSIPMRTMPATFHPKSQLPQVCDGLGFCPSWDTNTLPSQFWEDQIQGLSNSYFQVQKATVFIPIALRDSSTLIPLVSTFTTQRFAG